MRMTYSYTGLLAPQTPMPASAETLAEFGVAVEHHFGGGVYAKKTRIPAGRRLGKHDHEAFDHLSILASGTVVLSVEGEPDRTMTGPACIEVKAGLRHDVFAKSDAVWFCVHATDCTDTDEIDGVLTKGASCLG
jgi:quercetin dioxygenase-like cupin family protein